MSKVIAIANEKGGVGKTTTTMNLGIGLARMGKGVLLVDADTQASLTRCMGIVNPNELQDTLTKLMVCNIYKLDYPEGMAICHHEEGVDYIPANKDVSATLLSILDRPERGSILKRCIDRIRHKYDYVLIDTRGAIDLLTTNAFTAADSVLIPMQAESMATDDLIATVDAVRNIRTLQNPNLKFEGIVWTMVDSRCSDPKYIMKCIRDSYEDIIPFFKTVIPRAACASKSSGRRQSVYMYDAKNPVAEAYENLVREVIEND